MSHFAVFLFFSAFLFLPNLQARQAPVAVPGAVTNAATSSSTSSGTPERSAGSVPGETGSAPKQAASATSSDDPYRNEAEVIERYDTRYRMHADGTGDVLQHVAVRLQTEGAAQEWSVLHALYDSDLGTATVEHVRVRKPDGRVVETPSADAIEVSAPVTREAPVYSDLKDRQLPVRSLSVGDTLEFDLHTVYTQAKAPNQFWGMEHFLAGGAVVLSQTLTLEVPAGKPVKVWSPRHVPEVRERDGVKTYRWTSSQLKASSAKTADGKPDPPKDPDRDEEGRVLPSVAWTTFQSWTEVGDWYRGLERKRLEPTVELRARAEALTKDAKSPEEQVRALYEFVSGNIRYVSIDLGIGRYQPHFAAETLANQYGDCKDKGMLLEALLRAKGFKTATVLIGNGIRPIPEIPSPSTFNHVITVVELPEHAGAEKRIWLDATPGVSPYRLLLLPLRDQPALMIPTDAPASLVRTPADPPYPYEERFVAEATLTREGLLTGHMTMDLRSDNEPAYRMALRRAAPAEWDQGGQYLSSAMGFRGTVLHADLRQTQSDAPVHLAWDYRHPDFADWSNLRILPLFPPLDVMRIDTETQPEYDLDLGAPRTLVATTKIRLPEGFRADLPEPIHVARTYASFDKTYRLVNGELIVERKAVIVKRKVPKADWKDYLAYTKAEGLDGGEEYIQLIAPAKPVEATAKAEEPKTAPGKGGAEAGRKTEGASSVAPSESGASSGAVADAGGAGQADAEETVEALMEKAENRRRLGEFQAEKEILLRVKAKDPKTPYLWSMLGDVAERQGKLDEGIADVKQELQNHPEDWIQIPLNLSRMYVEGKRYDEAMALLKQYEDRDDATVSLSLSQIQVWKGDKAGALGTLARASEKHPDDRKVMNGYARVLHLAGRDTEAAAAAKAAIDGTEDANTLNSGAYLLAEMKAELPLAEKSARRSVDLLEEATAAVHVQEANSAAFLKTTNLLAAYDTLAYILLLENRAAEAEPYQWSSWIHQPNLVVGEHLAQIQEALGHVDEALRTDELALATEQSQLQEKEFAEVTSDAKRLRAAGAHGRGENSGKEASDALQAMRTFKVKRTVDSKGWGTFRVQIGAEGIVDSELVMGAVGIRPMTTDLNKLAIPHALPAGSKAKILRDGVLSCSPGAAECEFVLMPHSGLRQEAVQ